MVTVIRFLARCMVAALVAVGVFASLWPHRDLLEPSTWAVLAFLVAVPLAPLPAEKAPDAPEGLRRAVAVSVGVGLALALVGHGIIALGRRFEWYDESAQYKEVSRQSGHTSMKTGHELNQTWRGIFAFGGLCLITIGLVVATMPIAERAPPASADGGQARAWAYGHRWPLTLASSAIAAGAVLATRHAVRDFEIKDLSWWIIGGIVVVAVPATVQALILENAAPPPGPPPG
jgi:hypothetical protein